MGQPGQRGQQCLWASAKSSLAVPFLFYHVIVSSCYYQPKILKLETFIWHWELQLNCYWTQNLFIFEIICFQAILWNFWNFGVPFFCCFCNSFRFCLFLGLLVILFYQGFLVIFGFYFLCFFGENSYINLILKLKKIHFKAQKICTRRFTMTKGGWIFNCSSLKVLWCTFRKSPKKESVICYNFILRIFGLRTMFAI